MNALILACYSKVLHAQRDIQLLHSSSRLEKKEYVKNVKVAR